MTYLSLLLLPLLSINDGMNKDNLNFLKEFSSESHFLPLLYLIDGDKKRANQLKEFLLSQGLKVDYLSSPSEIYQLHLGQNNFLILLWMGDQPPYFSPEIIRKAKKIFGHLSLILGTFPHENQEDIRLIREGIVNQIVGPNHWPSLLAAIQSEIQKENLRRQLAQKQIEIRQINLTRQRTISRVEELEEIYNATLENLMTALDLRDVETFGHSKVVARYSLTLARILGIRDQKQLDSIHQGALLHDVGKIAIPDAILKKPAHLTKAEWEKIKLHPAVGYGLIKEIHLAPSVGHIVLYHHEHYDGGGYPFGLKKNKIPIEARIFALADALDAITSPRPYRRPRSFEEAKKEILASSGRQFDPAIVDAFCSLDLKEWEKIRFETTKILPPWNNFKPFAQD